MQAEVKLGFKTNYHIELIDSTTGKVKQEGDFHNIPTRIFNQFLCGTNSANEQSIPASSSGTSAAFEILSSLAVGSGTTEPAITQTELISDLWSVSADSGSKVIEWVDDYTVKGTATYTFPATSSYVGNVTEVGLGTVSVYTSENIWTRALLTDSEGQSISFNKTDIDILIVTVTAEVSLTSNSPGFYIFRKPYFLKRIIGDGVTAPNKWGSAFHIYMTGSPCLARYIADIELLPIYNSSALDQSLGYGAWGIARVENNTCYMRLDTTRMLSTTITSETYYRYFVIPRIGYWDLKNASVFPPYTITGLSIGTGDGATTQFTNPLNYFKAESEKIYKNGVQLTRDVDYTIDNIGNKDCLPELTYMHKFVKATSGLDLQIVNSCQPLIFPASIRGQYPVDASRYCIMFNYANPIYIELEEETVFNCFKANLLRVLRRDSSGSGSNSNVPAGTVFYVDYSLNGEDYIELTSVATADTTGTFTHDFEGVAAKYWRVRTSYNGGTNYYICGPDNAEDPLTLNRKSPYIVFTEAPADGDILTMDVDMDLIMKNANFVVDVSCQFNFSF